MGKGKLVTGPIRHYPISIQFPDLYHFQQAAGAVILCLKLQIMKVKNVELVVGPHTPHFVGDGFRVHNFIPGDPHMSMQRMNPFIMMDYNSKYYFSPTDVPRGVGVHPHKGFETVTLAYQGRVAHHDSTGNQGIIGEGDVQWMTAASGILHKEYHEKSFAKTGGDFQMVQLWVNLPSEGKRALPKYQEISHEKMSRYSLANHGGVIEVIAGQYGEVKGPATTFTPVHLMNARMNRGGKAAFSFPANYNTALLVIEGSIQINDRQTVPQDHVALFENSGENFTLEALENSIVLVMSGEPIDEPIAAHGPFVMNTQEELREAFREFSTGKFGHLENE
jgi:redox-sensitive bicupin YhaK (pirin superfamily)